MFKKNLLPPSEAKVRMLVVGSPETSVHTTRLHYIE
jgi:hypothetical protein